MTNGDKIRQMSDEEMLTFFFGADAYLMYRVIPTVITQGNVQITQESTISFLDWMKMECQE